MVLYILFDINFNIVFTKHFAYKKNCLYAYILTL